MAAKRRIGAKADSTAGPLAHYEGTPFSHYYHPRIGFLHATMILAKVGDLAHCIFRPSESKETVGVSPPSREKQVQVHGRESTGVLFGKKWQRNASQSAPPRVIYSDWNPFLLRMESSPSMRIL